MSVLDNALEMLRQMCIHRADEIEVERAQSELADLRVKCAELERYEAMVLEVCGELETFDEYRDALSGMASAQRQLDEAANQEPVGYVRPTIEKTLAEYGNGTITKEPAVSDAIKLYAEPINLPAIIEQAKAEEADRIGKLIHYPECWDTAAYPTLESALQEIHFCSQCYDNRAAAIRASKP